jgi:hypothetical protein
MHYIAACRYFSTVCGYIWSSSCRILASPICIKYTIRLGQTTPCQLLTSMTVSDCVHKDQTANQRSPLFATKHLVLEIWEADSAEMHIRKRTDTKGFRWMAKKASAKKKCEKNKWEWDKDISSEPRDKYANSIFEKVSLLWSATVS